MSRTTYVSSFSSWLPKDGSVFRMRRAAVLHLDHSEAVRIRGTSSILIRFMSA